MNKNKENVQTIVSGISRTLRYLYSTYQEVTIVLMIDQKKKQDGVMSS